MATTNFTHSLFKYDPSIAAASIFLILFLTTTVWHFYQIIRSKGFYLLAIVVCGTCEVTGYSSRLASRQYPTNQSLYSAQYAFLVLAPIFLAASIYVMLSRIIRFVDYPALISAKRITIIFVTSDVISFLVQIFGAIVLLNKSSASSANLGKNILLAGLIIQIIAFGFFTVCAIHFDISVAKSGRRGGKWRWLIKALYGGCALILGRSIFRVIEFSQSITGYLQTTEWPTYIFDALLVFIAMILFNIIHPAKYLTTETVIPEKNQTTANQFGVNNMPVVPVAIVKPVEIVENV